MISSQSEDSLVVHFALMSYDGLGTGTDRHLADCLSRGYRVLYVDPPVSMLACPQRSKRPDMLGSPALQSVHPSLFRLTPRVPPGLNRAGLHELTQLLVRRAARRAVSRLGGSVRAVIATTLEDVLCCMPGARTLFYGFDDHVAGAESHGIPRERWVRAERRQLQCADVVAAVSPALQERYAAYGR
ncbi:MAG TPA: hypothetical protein VJT72_21685, partial [Pseudonocardiaceae bacterium]|nr:hypothetical protein [Pseudonocardiaceae bacterium]